ncbi:MAG: prepilin peptidase [Candidatus Pacebacteria bacterium]|nr:prepilin peptidase [Candidatus Paceibacterota bacterium]
MNNVVLGIIVFIFGSVIGSFLNVLILRRGTGEGVFWGNSKCFSCGKKLKWKELFPIFSFLAQKGKCRGCKSKISWQYPILETITGLLFLLIFNFKFLIFNQFSNFHLLGIVFFLWLIVSILIVIAVYDFLHFIIPNGYVWFFNALAFNYMIYFSSFSLYDFLLDLSAGFLFGGFFAVLWFLSKGKWMGFGDAKLALGLGWFLGFEKVFFGFLFAFWVGSIIGLLLISLKKGYGLKSKIPFGPFLVFGSLLAFFWT